MSNYLFTLTITPVQSFITQARKTKDLFAGSEILSNIIRNTINRATKEYKAEIIFPQTEVVPQIEVVSNKFMAEFQNISEENIRDIGKKLEKFIHKEVIQLIFEHTKCYDSSLDNFFQVFWVAVELTDDYQQSYKRLEQSLGAIKNLRVFEQKTQPKGISKCILCGERNIAKADKDDNLCLVCYAKRCYLENEKSYPSLAKIALLDWLNNLDSKKKKNFINIFNKNEFDEELFFKDNLTEKYFKKVNIDIKKLQKAKDTLNEIDTKEQKKYYALIQFDIDSLGETLSDLDKEGQKKLSEELANFAEKVRDEILISEKKGQTIYAGGDDFLGFVNLSYLFEVIIDVQKAFGKTVKKEFSNLTYSTSIVIAHYKAPLHKVLDYSRELLAQTKNHFDDKNGVGIIVMSNSAINAQTICRYDDLPLLKEMRDKKIGMNLHYKLNSVFNFLDDTSMGYKEEYAYQMEMLEIEIKRLLKREQVDFSFDIYRKLINFLHQQVEGLDTETKITIDFDNFIGYLKTLEQLKKVM
jgi:CRISPR-associated protein Cmr2